MIGTKPHKQGIKVFARTGSSGIVHNFEVYIGKGNVKNVSPLGISGDIVLWLVDGLPKGQNYKVLTDNWLTSFSLMCALKEIGILALGTVRMSRLPNCSLKTDEGLKKLGRGANDCRTEAGTNVTALKWYDNKPVYLVSSYKGRHPVETVTRWSVAERRYVEVPRPAMVKEYNCRMGGFDLKDMLVALYRTNIGVKRYYLRIVFHLLDMCVVNAWLLYRRHCSQRGITKCKTLINFRSEIAHALLGAGKITVRKSGRSASNSPTLELVNKKKVRNSARVVEDVRYDCVGHCPAHTDKKQRCKFCIKACSRVKCVKCEKAFCLTKDKNCFMAYHIKQ